MKAALDADVLVYELGFAAEAAWRYQAAERGEQAEGPPPFDVVMEMIERRIPQIIEESGADEGVLFLTGKHNFRTHIAVTKPYKDRPGNKPFHYKNIKATLPMMYPHHMVEGLEADDLIGMVLTASPDEWIAVSRDKDIRQIPGHHYSWELERQPAIGPFVADKLGHIEIRKGKLFGWGDKFLFAQMITGDSVDSIPGIPKKGPVAALGALKDAETYLDMVETVSTLYKAYYQLEWKSVMREQARLLHLVRKFKNGRALLWDFPGEDETWIDVLTGEMYETAT